MANSIIGALNTYFGGCPLLEDGKINVDYLPEDTKKSGVEYSIDSTPAEEALKQYLDGSAVCQYVFTIRSVNDYGPDVLQQIANSGLFEALSEWMRNKTRLNELPELPTGLTPRSVEAMSTAYLAAAFSDAAKYQIQCRLVYYRNGGN